MEFQFIMEENHSRLYIFHYFCIEMIINKEEKLEEKKEQIRFSFPIHVHFIPALAAGLSAYNCYSVDK